MEPGHKILAGSLAVCFVIVVLNAEYFLAHLGYRVVPPRAAPVQTATSTSEATGEPDWLSIDGLGIEAPVVYIDKKDEKTYQAALKKGVVHFPGTAMPGEPGNVYIFGHSSDYAWADSPYRAVFALLTEIKIGDEVSLSDSKGRIFLYRVTGTKVVSPKDMTVLDQQGNEKRLLTLQTSYPLGTALRRFIVTAEAD